MSTPYVLDAWCLLALLQGEEPAAVRVRQILEAAQEGAAEIVMSIINLGEVYYRVGRLKGPDEAAETLAMVRRLPLRILSVSDETVMAAAEIKMEHVLSYADAFAVATARQRGAILVTGDPEIKALQGYVRIEMLLRRP